MQLSFGLVIYFLYLCEPTTSGYGGFVLVVWALTVFLITRRLPITRWVTLREV